MKNSISRFTMTMAAILVILCPGWGMEGTASAAGDLVVFAAASTTNALTEIGELFAAGNKGRITPSFASSSTLAKQIESGAPADLFLSADLKWMDYLEEKGNLAPGTRRNLLGNRLVLIVPAESSEPPLTPEPGMNLAGLLGNEGRLSMGDPGHVPAGTYAKAAMEKLGLWDQVRERLAPAKDVRAALVLVERSEAPLGIVYATDAAVSTKVRVLGSFPEESHPPVVYPVAAVKGPNQAAAVAFIGFLASPEARAVFEKHGFTVRQ
jgi:molybdate transport system substrate-binding protein